MSHLISTFFIFEVFHSFSHPFYQYFSLFSSNFFQSILEYMEIIFSSKKVVVLIFYKSNDFLFSILLHGNPSKCIYQKVCQNTQDRIHVFNHTYKDFLAAECTLIIAKLFFDLVHTDHADTQILSLRTVINIMTEFIK